MVGSVVPGFPRVLMRGFDSRRRAQRLRRWAKQEVTRVGARASLKRANGAATSSHLRTRCGFLLRHVVAGDDQWSFGRFVGATERLLEQPRKSDGFVDQDAGAGIARLRSNPPIEILSDGGPDQWCRAPKYRRSRSQARPCRLALPSRMVAVAIQPWLPHREGYPV